MPKNKGIEQCTFKSVEVHLDILNDNELRSEFSTLKDVFRASYGPAGRSNLIQHASGGYVTVTSNSSQILNSLTTVSSPVTRLLLQAVKSQINQFSDGGLFTGLLTLQLIESSLKSRLPRHKVIAVNEHVLSVILDHLKSTEAFVKFSVDLENLDQMLCIMRSILMTKPATGITEKEAQFLAVVLLQGFLKIIPTNGSKTRIVSLENLRIQECEGPTIGESSLQEGILLSSKNVREFVYENTTTIKVALFDSSLAGNVEDTWMDGTQTELSNNLIGIEENVLKSLIQMVDQMIDVGVKLVACQKVIHPTLQCYMMRKGLYYIERLSICHIQAVQKLTGATLLSSFLSHIDQDETALDELKLVTSSTLQALKEVLHHPFLVPGGGCFETTLAGYLLQMSEGYQGYGELGCTKEQYLDGLNSIASTFLYLARALDHENYDHMVDTSMYHHWITKTQAPLSDTAAPERCLCGLVTSNQDTEWYFNEEMYYRPSTGYRKREPASSKFSKNSRCDIFDVMTTKINGMKIAFSTANTILRIKHFVKEKFK